MKFEGLDIGNMPKEILSGKITVVNLRYILDLMNKIYKKYLDIDMGFYLIHENGNGYSIDSIYPQHWMSGRTCWGSSDKVGVYQWVKRCIQECQVDLTEYYILKNKNKKDTSDAVICWNQLYFILSWMDKPEYEYSVLKKKLIM